MKPSIYNENFEYNSYCFLYNVLYNSLIVITQELLEKIEKHNFENISSDVLSELELNGFVIQDDVDERELIKFTHNSVKYDYTQCSYMIYPTLTCNLDCPYCFEKVERKSMNVEQFDTLKNFLIQQAQNTKHTAIIIRWTGGEPLLVWEKIAEITTEVNTECVKNNIKFASSLSTNATLITEKIAKKIAALEFNPITVSIDGPRDLHNKRRFYKKNRGSFDDVVRGINCLSEYSKVILRVNFDKENYPSYERLLVELNESLQHKHNISMYLKPVTAAYNYGFDSTMYDDFDFFNIEEDLIQITQKHQFNLEIHPGFQYSTRCIAYQIGSYVVDPQLHLYKCPIHIGQEKEKVGYIDKNAKINIERFSECVKYINLSPFDNEECKNCRVLPLCNGKCPVKWEQLGHGVNQGCIPEKETIISKIKSQLLSDYFQS